MKILARNEGKKITIFRCERACIHFVYRNVNISMLPKEFRELNQSVQEGRMSIELGEWERPGVAIHYRNTTVVVNVEDFSVLAQVTAEAAGVVEQEISCPEFREPISVDPVPDEVEDLYMSPN